MSKTAIVYYRVSTDQQGRSGLGLAAQREAVERYVAQAGMEIIAEHVEIESGRKADRPQLLAAVETSKRTGATIVVSTLDRLGRNVRLISTLMDERVSLLAADRPHASRLELHLYAVLAEDERQRISDRTRAALKAAKDRGQRLGGRRGDSHLKATAIHQAKARKRNASTIALIERLKAAGIATYAGLARELTALKVPTPTGRARWYPNSVRQLLRSNRTDEERLAA